MAFGQPAGPPASARQVRELLELLQAAGHADFRDARGPMGFTQRQAGGRFTRDEADAFVAQLQHEAELADAGPAQADAGRDDADAGAGPRAVPQPVDAGNARRPQRSAPAARRPSTAATLRAIPDDVLAAELQRRGWIVVEP